MEQLCKRLNRHFDEYYPPIKFQLAGDAILVDQRFEIEITSNDGKLYLDSVERRIEITSHTVSKVNNELLLIKTLSVIRTMCAWFPLSYTFDRHQVIVNFAGLSDPLIFDLPLMKFRHHSFNLNLDDPLKDMIVGLILTDNYNLNQLLNYEIIV